MSICRQTTSPRPSITSLHSCRRTSLNSSRGSPTPTSCSSSSSRWANAYFLFFLILQMSRCLIPVPLHPLNEPTPTSCSSSSSKWANSYFLFLLILQMSQHLFPVPPHPPNEPTPTSVPPHPPNEQTPISCSSSSSKWANAYFLFLLILQMSQHLFPVPPHAPNEPTPTSCSSSSSKWASCTHDTQGCGFVHVLLPVCVV